MFSRFKNDKLLGLIVILAVIVFFVVSYFIMISSKSVSAIVLKSGQEAGTVITKDMIQEVQVPIKTPVGYLRNESSIVGYKLKTSVEADQLLYESNFMSSWTNYSDSEKIPDDYVIASVSIPDERACGGIITAGDYIDILQVSPYQESGNTWTSRQVTATEINGTGRSDTGTSVAYILSNVYVLNTNSSLSKSQESDLSVSQSENKKSSSSDEGSFYIFALSYDDYKKLRQAENVANAKLWLNICPKQNQQEGKKPLIKQMIGQSYSFLHDAQVPVQDENGNMLVDEYYIPGSEGRMIAAPPENTDQTPAEGTPETP